MKSITGLYNRILAIILLLTMIFLSGCDKESKETVEVDVKNTGSDEIRSNEPICLEPKAPGEKVVGNSQMSIDISNSQDGYICVSYNGENADVKLQLACDGAITYTYVIPSGQTVLPLTEGSGNYKMIAYEGMGNGQYSVMFTEDVGVELKNEYSTYLYPNYYVNFTKDSEAVEIGRELAGNCTCDLEVISSVYKYVVDNIAYDHEEAENVSTSYVPDVDEILDTKKGICLDYASLMAAMLRSQRIPTRLEVGYAGDAYHAWVTTYVEDIGWINGIIQFDGADWTLMDPTFAANADKKTLKAFLGDGNNYTTKYIY